MYVRSNIKLILSLLLAAAMLSWPAIYNGYPFIFPDTQGYLLPAIQLLETGWLSPAWSRPPFYGLAALPIHMNWSLWPMVIIQALIISHFLFLTVRTVLGQIDHRAFLGVIFALAALTSLPWHVATLIPDIFAPVLLLGIFLLAYPGHALKPWEQVYVLAITIAAAAFHLSHVALAACLAGLTGVLWLSKGFTGQVSRNKAFITAIPFAMAIVSLVAVNHITRGTTAVASHSSLFLLSKYRSEVTQYLRENCHKESYILCEYKDGLGSVLWGGDSLVAKVGANRLNDEAKELVRKAFWSDPAAVVNSALDASLKQLVTFWTGGWIYPLQGEGSDRGGGGLFAYFDREHEDFLSSKQSTSALPFSIIRLLHTIVILAAAPLFLLFLLRAYRRSDTSLISLYVFILSGLVANAVICATLSGVVERYQSRLIWLVVFVCVIASFRLSAELANAVRSRNIA